LALFCYIIETLILSAQIFAVSREFCAVVCVVPGGSLLPYIATAVKLLLLSFLPVPRSLSLCGSISIIRL
jgi:hypothetical protein